MSIAYEERFGGLIATFNFDYINYFNHDASSSEASSGKEVPETMIYVPRRS